jgi:hypothetical protein
MILNKESFEFTINYVKDLAIHCPIYPNCAWTSYGRFLKAKRYSGFDNDTYLRFVDIEPHFKKNGSFIDKLELILKVHKMIEDCLLTGLLPLEEVDQTLAQNLRKLYSRSDYIIWVNKAILLNNKLVSEIVNILNEILHNNI